MIYGIAEELIKFSVKYGFKNPPSKWDEYGKTEMWYIFDREDGAELVYSFKENISKEVFEKCNKDNALIDICNFVPVHKGDVFFIETSTLHEIGEGDNDNRSTTKP